MANYWQEKSFYREFDLTKTTEQSNMAVIGRLEDMRIYVLEIWSNSTG